MILFIKKCILFAIPIVAIVIIGLLLPTTPRASKSLIMSAIRKDSLLEHTPSPRIIFVGGSNLSFGLSSSMIKDSLGLNSINTAINAAIGLRFMINNTLQFIKKSDIIIIVPEYSHFYGNPNAMSKELMRSVFDVDMSKLKLLNINQILNIIPYAPKYALSKFDKSEYGDIKESDVYSVNSFNEFGDTYTHWDMKRQDFSPYDKISGTFNFDIVDLIKNFDAKLKKKGAQLYFSYPSYQDISFDKSILQIQKIEAEMRNTNIPILGDAMRYRIPDSMMFNTPYHLNKAGVDFRTKRFIEDFRKAKGL